jgi:hypothetical protein
MVAWAITTPPSISTMKLKNVGRAISAVVSIGTGKARGNRLARDMRKAATGKHVLAYAHVALVLKHIATSSEARERLVYQYFGGPGKLDCYYRFNDDKGMEVELHEYKKYGGIRQCTKAYLETPTITQIIDRCARKLASLSGSPIPTSRQAQTVSPRLVEDEASTLVLEETIQQFAEELEDDLTASGSGRVLEALMTSANPIFFELKPLFQLDIKLDSIAVRIRPLRKDNNLPIEEKNAINAWKPMISTAAAVNVNDQSNNQGTSVKPLGELAFAFETNSPNCNLVLEYTNQI